MRKLFIIMLLPLFLFLTGCQTSMLIEDADIKTIAPLLTDYALLNGYKILYRNDQTGAYRIHLGKIYIPAQLTTYRESATVIDTKDILYDLTKYEESTFKAISQKDQYIDLVIMLRLLPINTNLKLNIESDSADYYQPTSSQANKFKRYLENSGFTVKIL